MSTHKSTKGKRGGHIVLPTDHQSLVRFADLLQLRSLAYSTRAEYLRYVRRLGARAGVDPATLTEEPKEKGSRRCLLILRSIATEAVAKLVIHPFVFNKNQ